MNNIHGLGSNRASQPRGGGGGGTPGCMDQIKQGWYGLPLFNKYLITLCTGLYLISWITPLLSYYMILVPGFLLQF